MKRSILFPSVLLLLTGFACKDLGTFSQDQRVPPRPLTSAESALVTADNSFGFKLFNAVNKTEAAKSVFISPVSVSMALGMTLNGSNGTTRTAMIQALEFAGMTQADINTSYKSLITLLSGLDPKVTLQIANSIWHRPELNVEPAFKEVNRLNFNAEINSLNFSDPNASNTINAWVDRCTKGKITKIVPNPIPSEMVMYLINAIYFKGSWTTSFDSFATRDDFFTRSDGSRTSCKMMFQKGKLRYHADSQLQAIDLPYGDAGFSMTVLLPSAGTNIDDFAGNLSQENWNSSTSRLAFDEVELHFPKFKFEYDKTLNDMLKSMGMSIAFSPNDADFTNIDKRGQLYISEVKHKTYVQVDEEGTEAAAVTSVGVGVTSIGPNTVMRVDRPFIFVIRENSTGTILFIGKIVEPKV
jgi:serine protease inhibitor